MSWPIWINFLCSFPLAVSLEEVFFFISSYKFLDNVVCVPLNGACTCPRSGHSLLSEGVCDQLLTCSR